jgi:hypothetical protein
VNGVVELGGESGLVVGAGNVRLPDPTLPNNLLAPFWTDMNLGDGGNWYAAILTDGVNLYDVISWEACRGRRRIPTASDLGIEGRTPCGLLRRSPAIPDAI